MTPGSHYIRSKNRLGPKIIRITTPSSTSPISHTPEVYDDHNALDTRALQQIEQFVKMQKEQHVFQSYNYHLPAQNTNPNNRSFSDQVQSSSLSLQPLDTIQPSCRTRPILSLAILNVNGLKGSLMKL
jgi:hypothetical protein